MHVLHPFFDHSHRQVAQVLSETIPGNEQLQVVSLVSLVSGAIKFAFGYFCNFLEVVLIVGRGATGLLRGDALIPHILDVRHCLFDDFSENADFFLQHSVLVFQQSEVLFDALAARNARFAAEVLG